MEYRLSARSYISYPFDVKDNSTYIEAPAIDHESVEMSHIRPKMRNYTQGQCYIVYREHSAVASKSLSIKTSLFPWSLVNPRSVFAHAPLKHRARRVHALWFVTRIL